MKKQLPKTKCSLLWIHEGLDLRSLEILRVNSVFAKEWPFWKRRLWDCGRNKGQSFPTHGIPEKGTWFSLLARFLCKLPPPPGTFPLKHNQDFRVPAGRTGAHISKTEVLPSKGLHFQLTFWSPKGSVQTSGIACLRISCTSNSWKPETRNREKDLKVGKSLLGRTRMFFNGRIKYQCGNQDKN